MQSLSPAQDPSYVKGCMKAEKKTSDSQLSCYPKMKTGLAKQWRFQKTDVVWTSAPTDKTWQAACLSRTMRWLPSEFTDSLQLPSYCNTSTGAREITPQGLSVVEVRKVRDYRHLPIPVQGRLMKPPAHTTHKAARPHDSCLNTELCLWFSTG